MAEKLLFQSVSRVKVVLFDMCSLKVGYRYGCLLTDKNIHYIRQLTAMESKNWNTISEISA